MEGEIFYQDKRVSRIRSFLSNVILDNKNEQAAGCLKTLEVMGKARGRGKMKCKLGEERDAITKNERLLSPLECRVKRLAKR